MHRLLRLSCQTRLHEARQRSMLQEWLDAEG